jgi:LmbE family N-acetylglucosaminyl deacetylase
VATLVCFHAHPDDESMNTGGTIAHAVSLGHRVVLVVATGGELGEKPDDLADGETLAMRRFAETQRSAEILGISSVEFLGYEDSGMTGWDGNSNPASFWQAPLDEAAERLAAILRRESADVLTIYDDHGGYGHPDHIAVHRVGVRAAELAATAHVYEATMNRTRMIAMIEGLKAGGADIDWDPNVADDGNPVGTIESEITTAVDVSAYAALKRASVGSHVSQVSDAGFFMQMSDEEFLGAFGTEWFVRRGVTIDSMSETWLAGL